MFEKIVIIGATLFIIILTVQMIKLLVELYQSVKSDGKDFAQLTDNERNNLEKLKENNFFITTSLDAPYRIKKSGEHVSWVSFFADDSTKRIAIVSNAVNYIKYLNYCDLQGVEVKISEKTIDIRPGTTVEYNNTESRYIAPVGNIMVKNQCIYEILIHTNIEADPLFTIELRGNDTKICKGKTSRQEMENFASQVKAIVKKAIDTSNQGKVSGTK